jgi:polar amino acid transport system substrate-binding protein
MRKVLIAAALASLLVFAASATGKGTSGAGASCDKGSLQLIDSGTLTIGTNNPAFTPWFGGGERAGSKWEINDPATGQGYESAVAYDIAKRLGFAPSEVKWIVVPFNKSFAPGKKPFDFFINQVSITPQRKKNVTFSISYYNVNQSVVGIKGTPITKVKFVSGLRKYKLGTEIGTTSYDYIVKFIQPSEEPGVFDTNNDAVSALKNKQIDGLVVDFPTSGYVTAVQVPNSAVVGRLPTRGSQEHFGLVLQKGNPLVACVNRALSQSRSDGTLRRFDQKWLGRAGAPILK